MQMSSRQLSALILWEVFLVDQVRVWTYGWVGFPFVVGFTSRNVCLGLMWTTNSFSTPL